MATIEEIQAGIVEDFSFLPQWDERYAYLIELGQKMEPLPKNTAQKKISCAAANPQSGCTANAVMGMFT